MTQRRELSKQYKETGPRMGVYAIRNGAGKVVFVGASLNVDGAMNRDRFELKNKTHRNKRLLEDWLRWGADGLRFEVIDILKKRDDPAFDPQAELASLLALWREELDGQRETGVSSSDAFFTASP
ncbi:GIY-YIG nuclease family protein [Variovorax sp. LT1R16]|uniref:GIY-YIG nuclease family protein n=1 Tax=Variovorax sp. LT1R16 TaxID=3443728 RepID=UPI003F44AAC1